MATHDSTPPARRLLPQEMADMLNLAIPAHLATLERFRASLRHEEHDSYS